MFNFRVKQVGFSTDINDPLNLDVIEIPKGEWWSMTVPKASLGGCNLKMATVKNTKNIIDADCNCEIEVNTIQQRSCIYNLPNDEKAYLNLVMLDKENVDKFTIFIDGDEAFEFDGGTYEEFVNSVEQSRIGIEELGYGVRLFFDKSYNGRSATTNSETTYLLNDVFCLNYSKYVGIDFAFCEIGCYKIIFMDNDGNIKSISNPFNVVNRANRKTKIIEYQFDGFYHRHRIGLELKQVQFVNEEEQKSLSNGDISISNLVVRPQRDFYTSPLTESEHLRLIQIFKSEFKLDGKKCLMIGGYDNSQEFSATKSIGSGTLSFKDGTIKSSDSCGQTCSFGSIFRFEVYETERIGNILLG